MLVDYDVYVQDFGEPSADSTTERMFEGKLKKFVWPENKRCKRLEKFTGEDVGKASTLFPYGTSGSPDGWHPRQYGHLSDGALEGLGFLYRVYEVATTWSSKQSSLLVRLIDKLDGDLRPILWSTESIAEPGPGR